MSIAIMIGTHGAAAEQLLHTAEMLIGEQENVSYIDFVPGENADTLFDKYNQKLESLNTEQGVLFFVDTWGGSPFNAANRIVVDKSNYEIVTGVNVPMLVEAFMCRDDDPSMEELVSVALETGREGIRALKTEQAEETQKPEPVKPAAPTIAPASSPTVSGGGHMKIALARIDDRLIHGQVATRWTKETNVKRIIVVSDDVAQDTIRSTLLKQVAPPGVSAHVIDVAKCVRVYNNPKYAGERVMLLFTNPTDVLRIVEGGVSLESINIGGMAFRQGKTQINNAISVDSADIEAFEKLNSRGIELEARKVSSDTRLNMIDLLKKA
ncbi:PTS mannose transporter subunit IIAB [Xenorhabdus bovienii]|uniref:PTS system mannose-specific EIIAB component n=5 Tax=Xenorhabdus bovienii TaxID=40576 RepID=A0A0B6X835_XENBV|nr:PTS mannose transporter subunit IIAB [Xenorhabdus bovienii]MCG3462848.1 PTS mannose transporter subunit IIAB [Xenorhabdus bovienii]CDG87864.1 PTS family enzyme IIA (N-terminal); enzyme IIB (C-terminal), mannose-specific [Xenorhabdus bovienii str. feltiae France]CDG94537.1 PTS family enzyme IIA (N-terminal); enzyme IIB (C-terminal), mannose-specific [Xenorhabdus bovienii str. feltiae Florida]CDG97483.1 PTS family enzyme IIA (N-terminal); enzyme IIB (C-terminal), mannose-specific [Xenorhabdus 